MNLTVNKSAEEHVDKHASPMDGDWDERLVAAVTPSLFTSRIHRTAN